MAGVDGTETAREIFAAAWRLYAKYAAGPSGDADAYWHNLAEDAGKVAREWPCELAEELAGVVLKETDRRERRKRGNEGNIGEAPP